MTVLVRAYLERRICEVDLTDRRAHNPELELHVQRATVLPRRRLGTIVTRSTNETVDAY
jgi:hypothetical protein